jgi:hypothetical protein
MNGLIQELVNELNSNVSVKDAITTKMVVESINNSILLGVSPAEVFENALNTLTQLSESTANESLKEVVAKFKSLANTPAKKLKDMSGSADLATKVKALQESALATDPVFRHTLAILESGLNTQPEFRMISHFISGLSKYSYDPAVSEALADVSSHLEQNRSKFEIMNAVHEMRQASPVIYKEACSILEECLLEGTITSDSLKMKLRGKVNMPIVNRLVNTLSMVEARSAGTFNIGIGNGDAQVNSVVLPYLAISENEVVTVVDNSFVKLSTEEAPVQIESEKVEAEYPEFFEMYEALNALGFSHTGNNYTAKLKTMTVGFELHENSLQFTVNGKSIEDAASANVSEIFVMESVETRTNIAKVLSNLENIAHLDFAKRLINERLGNDAYVFTVNESLFVFEKLGQTRTIKKMEGTTFHNYVMENFQYDVTELYSIQLEESAEFNKNVDSEKARIEKNIEKLESSIKSIDEALATASVNEDYSDKLGELKLALEKNVNSLKSQYITLDQSKKKA